MRFCQACGNSLEPGARFCAACGKPVNGGSSSILPDPVATAGAAAALTSGVYSAAPNVEFSRTPDDVAHGTRTGEKAVRAHRPLGVAVLAVLALLAIIPAVSLGMAAFSYAASASAEGAIPLVRLLMQLFPVLAQGQQEAVNQGSVVAALSFAIAAICAALSYSLWKLRKWGRVLAIVSSALLLLHAALMIFASSGSLLWHLFVIGINIWVIMYFLKPKVKQAFGA